MTAYVQIYWVSYKVKVSVVGVTEVTWKGVTPDGGAGTNLESTSKNGGGKRIMPGRNTPAGKAHLEIISRAKLSRSIPSDASIDVHFQVFDVDDPSQNFDPATVQQNPVDTNDSIGQDGNIIHRGDDNRPNADDGVAPTGISPTQLKTVSVNNDQFAEITYTLDEVNPGNNYKAFASMNAMVASVAVDASVPNGENDANSFLVAGAQLNGNLDKPDKNIPARSCPSGVNFT